MNLPLIALEEEEGEAVSQSKHTLIGGAALPEHLF